MGRLRTKAALLVGCSLTVLTLTGPALAADWTQATDNDWFVGTNWSTGTVPTSADAVFIDVGAAVVTSPGAEAAIFFVGHNADGQLIIASGGTLFADVGGSIGEFAGSEGDVTISGPGSSVTIDGDLFIGQLGYGELRISDGGVLETTGVAGRIYVGYGSTGSSLITVSGSGSALETVGVLAIGVDGSAELIASDGAQVLVNQGFASSEGLALGASPGGTGSATFIGDGTLLDVGLHAVIGDAGTGILNIIAGADGVMDAALRVGWSSGGVGAVSVQGAGSTLSIGGRVIVGNDGTGEFLIADGGSVSGDDLVTVGSHAGSVGTVVITGAGSNWVSTGSSLDLGSAGTGTLTISDGGRLQHGGVAVIGRTATGLGTVTVTGTDSIWSNFNTITIGYEGEAALTIAEGGVVIASGGVTLAELAGSTGTLIVGAAADSEVEAGTLFTPSLDFGDGAGTLIFNHAVNPNAVSGYTFDASISGSGAINHLAGTTTLTGDSVGFSGTTTVSGGELYVSGRLAGLTEVLSGGLLGGTGVANYVTAGSGGTIAPGNSIGTITVDSITFNAGSVYEVEVDSAGSSDLINATGATINGGTVEVVPFPSYAIGTTYTIITTSAGLTGAFDAATFAGGSLFVTPTVTYDANNAYLTLAQAATLAGPTETPNQKAAAAGVQSLGAGNEIYDAILSLGTAAEAQDAFDALSGEIHASAKTALIEDSRFARQAALGRARSAFDGVASGAGQLVLAAASDGLEIAPPDTDRFALWGEGFGSWGEWDGDGNAAELDRSIGGFFVGGDALVTESLRLGVLAGYSHSSFDADDRSSSGSSDSYHLGAYGGSQWGALGLRFGGTYAWHDVDMDRSAEFTGFSDRLSADYDAATAQVFGEVGYAIGLGRASVEPYANVTYVNLHTDGFEEDGGAAALRASSDNFDTTLTTLGVRGELDVSLGSVEGRLHGGLGWRHAFDRTPSATMHFAGGSDFAVAAVPIEKDAFLLDAGFEASVTSAVTLDLSYGGQFGSDVTDQSIAGSFTLKF